MPATAQDAEGAFGDARVSPQRRSIAAAARRLNGAFTVDELVRTVHEHDAGIGMATVYRAVSALESNGWLERVGEREGSALYVRCDTGGHHHHVVCEGCGRVEATECPVELASIARPEGFRITRHEVTLYGLCPECSAAAGGKA